MQIKKLYDLLATASMYALTTGLFNRIKRPENKSEEPKDMMGLGLFLDIQRSADRTRFPNIKKYNKLIMNLVNEYRIGASGRGTFVC